MSSPRRTFSGKWRSSLTGDASSSPNNAELAVVRGDEKNNVSRGGVTWCEENSAAKWRESIISIDDTSTTETSIAQHNSVLRAGRS